MGKKKNNVYLVLELLQSLGDQYMGDIKNKMAYHYSCTSHLGISGLIGNDFQKNKKANFVFN